MIEEAGEGHLAIDTHGLVRRFGEQLAVDGIDLRVPRGSFYGFLGENGAGKSTTISMLTGVLAPTAGTMRVLGREVTGEATEVKRRIGVVPDGMLLFDRLTGRVAAAEYIDHVDCLADLGKTGVAALAMNRIASRKRIDRDRAVALPLQVPHDAVARPMRARAGADHRDGFHPRQDVAQIIVGIAVVVHCITVADHPNELHEPLATPSGVWIILRCTSERSDEPPDAPAAQDARL